MFIPVSSERMRLAQPVSTSAFLPLCPSKLPRETSGGSWKDSEEIQLFKSGFGTQSLSSAWTFLRRLNVKSCSRRRIARWRLQVSVPTDASHLWHCTDVSGLWKNSFTWQDAISHIIARRQKISISWKHNKILWEI